MIQIDFILFQGSRWTLQATRMDGELFGYLIKPDQMQVRFNIYAILWKQTVKCKDELY